MKHDPLREACWRFEQIGPLLNRQLTASERRRMIEEMARVCLVWPSGREAPVPVSTIYRWLKAYLRLPRIESLMRATRPRKAVIIRPEWVAYALAQLEEEPKRSLFILGMQIRNKFGLKQAPSQASLYRALKPESRYRRLRHRARGETRLRRRFQAARAHEIWHADAKAPFEVRFADGTRHKAQILSILDDATRFVLAALIVSSESLGAAVATFRAAAARWGLPDKFYADRGSAYDADTFRKGLAVLGVHRINTRSRNPSAHGKIEAYHRSLQRWFVAELKHQPLRDMAHLQNLLDALIDQVYHEHVHRELKQTSRAAFANRMSNRLVSLQRLREAFLVEKTLTAHKKTGEVRVGKKLYLAPERFWGPKRNVRIAVDPESPESPYIVVSPGVYEPLTPAFPQTKKPVEPDLPGDEPIGPLTPLLERYRGRKLPQAHPGFGLPEIYEELSRRLARNVPATEAEATAICQWLARSGPFEPKAFFHALDKTLHALGSDRPIALIIKALDHRIATSKCKEEHL